MKTIAIWILNDGFPRLPFCEWVRACWQSKSFPWTGCGRGFPPHKREGAVFSSFITRHLTRFPDLINFPKCDTRWPAGMGFSTHSQFPSVKTKPLPRRTVSNGDAFLSSLFGRVWHTHTRTHVLGRTFNHFCQSTWREGPMFGFNLRFQLIEWGPIWWSGKTEMFPRIVWLIVDWLKWTVWAS